MMVALRATRFQTAMPAYVNATYRVSILPVQSMNFAKKGKDKGGSIKKEAV